MGGMTSQNKPKKSPMATEPQLPQVNFSEDGEVRYLHLGSEWVQGSMWLDKPYEIELDYVRRMMAWLLFVEDLNEVPQMHAMQLGLGAASLTKFCFKKLETLTTAVEINPDVVAVCRHWFKLPANNAKLNVVLGDAAHVLKQPEWRRSVDALQVDLYDHEAAGPVLDSADFYASCRDVLSENGVMTVNLFGRHASFNVSMQNIAQVFGEDAIWAFTPTREGNCVVLAQARAHQPERLDLLARAQAIEARYKLPCVKWLKMLKPWRDSGSLDNVNALKTE
jgi:spermidine synthase